MAPDEATIADSRMTTGQAFDILLKPVSHPELGEIRIDEELFAIGRTEAPFVTYPPELVADLSRRHARIFCEYGSVYIVDLGSKNGTTVNGTDIRQKIAILRDGDEICFGGTLSYRVQLGVRVQTPRRAERLFSLTLIPEHGDLGIQPIIVTQFPFLISKADDAFSRYKDEYPHQVNYISRRHAHIFLKGGEPFVEDLGSTNGTFVAGKRLDEHAVPLKDGDVLAFGGHHFVYRVSVQKEAHEVDPTVTKMRSAARSAPEAAPANADKTTFVAAADSFLDIFCVDPAPQPDEEVNDEAAKHAVDAGNEAEKRPARSKFAIFFSELSDAFLGRDRSGMKRGARWGAALALLVGLAGLLLYLNGESERDLKGLLASGDYAAASAAAREYLERDPDNAELRALGTEALLKAEVPKWLAMLRAKDFDHASAVLAGMRESGRRNTDVQPLLNELEWMGTLERFIAQRGGANAPIRPYADEDRINALLKRWDEDTQAHQRAFVSISSYVPEFRDPYAEALSHLRKLQSDDSVYMAAIERLKAAIASELDRDNPQALESLLKEYAEKYPRLQLDGVRQDLRQYLEIQTRANERRLGPLLVSMDRARFSTPPFQQKFRTLVTSGRLPSANIGQQYQAVSRSWREGDSKQALAGLQKMADAGGPWADGAIKEMTHKNAIVDRFAELQKTRGTKGFDERLLAFYGELDPVEDGYFIRATEGDIALYRDKALVRAQELLNQARTRWTQYRDNGVIDGQQRLESAVSSRFRTQARLLSEADDGARQAMRIYTQLKAEPPAQWVALHNEIKAEAEQQRKSLQDLQTVLEPRLLKEKMALLGGREEERR